MHLQYTRVPRTAQTVALKAAVTRIVDNRRQRRRHKSVLELLSEGRAALPRDQIEAGRQYQRLHDGGATATVKANGGHLRLVELALPPKPVDEDKPLTVNGHETRVLRLAHDSGHVNRLDAQATIKAIRSRLEPDEAAVLDAVILGDEPLAQIDRRLQRKNGFASRTIRAALATVAGVLDERRRAARAFNDQFKRRIDDEDDAYLLPCPARAPAKA